MNFFRKINLSETLIYCSFLLFALYPLIPERSESVPVIVFLVVGVVTAVIDRKTLSLKWPYLIISIIPFMTFLLSVLFSDDKYLAFKKIETMTSLLVFPVIFYVLLSNHKINKLRLFSFFQHLFFASNVIYSIIAFYFMTNYRNPKFPVKGAAYFRSALTDIPLIGEHPIYISIFLSVAILLGIGIYNTSSVFTIKNIFVGLGHIILSGFLIILMSKGVIIALVFAVSFFVLFKIKNKRYYFFGLLALLLIGVFIPGNNNRFKNLFENNQSSVGLKFDNSTSIRLLILRCNLELIKEEIIFGYGVGDVQPELNQCLNSKNNSLSQIVYNSHNQYLFLWLSAGVLGLTFFLLYLLFYFKIAFKNNNYIFSSILILYTITFFTENVLSRQSGVIFFSFIVNFFVWFHMESNEKIIENSKEYFKSK